MVATVCQVMFGDTVVGALLYNDDDHLTRFEYTPEWLRYGFSLSPIHLPLRKGVFVFPALSYETYKGLPAVFADSLPDDFGNSVINAWLAGKGLDPAHFKPIDRLLYTGKRGMGALEYYPATKLTKHESFEVDIAGLVELADAVLNTRQGFTASLQHDNAMVQLLQIGTSAGGARPKALIALNADRTKVLSGQTDVPVGFEHYLLKFDGISSDNKDKETFGDPLGYGVMEYVYYQLATQCGIEMAKCSLLHEQGSGRRHFLTKRFDRISNQKYHVATLCAMDHADFKKPGQYSYEQLLGVLRKLNFGYEEQEQIFKRMVFNIVARNQDDHAKNFSFMVDDVFQWRLAPAYDVAFSYKPGSPWVDQHQLSVNGKRDNFTLSDILSVATLITNLNEAKAKQIVRDTIDVVKTWPQLARHEGVPQWLIDFAAKSHRLYF